LRRRRQVAVLAEDPRMAVLDAQRQLYRTARRLGQPRAPQETTPEVLRRWEQAGQVPTGTGAVATTVQAAAFGGELTPPQAAAAVATLDRARSHLANTSTSAEVARSWAQEGRARAGRLRRRLRDRWNTR
jgi:hypothetical protein